MHRDHLEYVEMWSSNALLFVDLFQQHRAAISRWARYAHAQPTASLTLHPNATRLQVDAVLVLNCDL